jgi:hypothetical protein
MARVEIAGDRLSVQIEGMDRLWSLRSRLEIPLAHASGAGADPDRTVAAVRRALGQDG